MPKIDPENRFEVFFQQHQEKFLKLKKAFTYLGIIVFSLFLIELSSFLVIKIYRGINSARGGNPPEETFATDWYQEYMTEMKEANVAEYEPYVSYKIKPSYHGKYVNIDENSLRRTSNPCANDGTGEALKVFVFGGSTIWGVGVRDEYTIPSYVSEYLCEAGIKAEIKNYGNPGYSNNQEMISLLLDLKKGNIPDIAIFYDGHNDVWGSYINGNPGLSEDLVKRELEFNSSNRAGLIGIFHNFFEILRYIENKLKIQEWPYKNNESFNKEIAQSYLSNTKIIEGVGHKFGFETLFFWQPNLFTKDNPSQFESENIYLDKDVAKSYKEVTKEVIKDSDIIDLSDIFDTYDKTIYMDSAHPSEEGNRIIAEKMANTLIKGINENN
jgi:lysophospholipase L1-like esterase